MKVIHFNRQQKTFIWINSVTLLASELVKNLSSMGIGNLAVDDFAQAIKDVLEGNQTAISHNEAREIVNKYFEELESKMGAVAIEQGQAFLEENKKRTGRSCPSQRTTI